MGAYKKTRKDGSFAWYYDFTFKGIRYRGVGGSTKTMAVRTQEKIRDSVIAQEYSHVKDSKSPKFDAFTVKFLNRRKDKKSWNCDNQKVNNLLVFFKVKHLNQIKSEDIEDYKIFRLKQGVGNATVNRDLACLRRMYNLAILWGDARNNPVKNVTFLTEPPGRTRFLSKDEINILADKCSPIIRPVVLTAVNTGMRMSEILNLEWENIYIDSVIEPHIEITHSKNNKKRFIPLNDFMIELLQNLKLNPELRGAVFLNRYGKPLRKLTNQFKLALGNAGIENFCFHDLRHTFASHFVMCGGDVISLKEILGHSSIKMVERYAHLASSHKRKLINNLNYSDKKRHLYATREQISKSS
jgi:integrase